MFSSPGIADLSTAFFCCGTAWREQQRLDVICLQDARCCRWQGGDGENIRRAAPAAVARQTEFVVHGRAEGLARLSGEEGIYLLREATGFLYARSLYRKGEQREESWLSVLDYIRSW